MKFFKCKKIKKIKKKAKNLDFSNIIFTRLKKKNNEVNGDFEEENRKMSNVEKTQVRRRCSDIGEVTEVYNKHLHYWLYI